MESGGRRDGIPCDVRLDRITLPTELPRPLVTAGDAVRILETHWGLAGEIRELGSQQDRNFLLDTGERRFVLKLGNPGIPTAHLERQHAALAVLDPALSGIELPRPRPTLDGAAVVEVEVQGVPLAVRLLDYVDGEPLTGRRIPPALATALGRTAGRLVETLAALPTDSDAPATMWDLRLAAALTHELADSMGDVRDEVLSAVRVASLRLQSVSDALPVQLIHGDLTDDNVVARGDEITGVIDFGDLGPGWRIAELAVGVAATLHHDPGEPLRVLSQIAAFDTVVPLSEPEVVALWPLVVLRAAALVASGRHQVRLDGDNAYAEAGLEREWVAFRAATEIDLDEAELAIRAALGRTPSPPVAGTIGLLGGSVAAVTPDLTVYSAAMDRGAWLEPDIDARIAAETWSPGMVVVSRYGERRASRARPLSSAPPRSAALRVDITLDPGAPLVAPFDATVAHDRGAVVVKGDGVELRILGAVDIRLGWARAGDLIGAAGSESPSRLAVTASAISGLAPPAFARASEMPIWLVAAPDPTAWLGITREPDPATGVPDTQVDADALLERRDASYAVVHERYFDAPPRIERGWRHHLLDEDARSYLDMVNNVTIVGHGHPRIAEAAARQWLRLNTNSRFHYGELVRYSERLASLAPDGLDTVFLVNSGTEAVDLSLRLAAAASTRTDVVALREAYHGWSSGADAVSSSLNDNPNALATRPPWVHLADTPNAIRGRHLGPGAAEAYLRDLDALLAALDSAGTPVGGFIAEAVFGNGGGMLLPDGYLAGAYDLVRRRGGICIADEVQVGFGRLGAHFWGFEQQGAVPDVIAIAKSIGNGHPLGAVITTREIADAFGSEGSFFSSAGGSPVSCAVGNAVLDVLASERLQEHAIVVGERLLTGLRGLAERHPSIGAVHGMGLYLGVELVTDRATMSADAPLAHDVCEALLAAGVILLPTGDGKNVLKIKPPMTIDADAVDFFLVELDRTLRELGGSTR